MKEEINVGDWVRSYRPGIWNVYRVLRYKTRDPVTLAEVEETIVFSKRFLSGSMKESLSYREECCARALVEHLSDEAMHEVEKFIAKNPEALKRFDAYTPKKIDSVYNARISLPARMRLSDVEKLIPKTEMFTVFQIEKLLGELGLLKNPYYETAQFVSPNHSCRDGYLVYSFSRVLPH